MAVKAAPHLRSTPLKPALQRRRREN